MRVTGAVWLLPAEQRRVHAIQVGVSNATVYAEGLVCLVQCPCALCGRRVCDAHRRRAAVNEGQDLVRRTVFNVSLLSVQPHEGLHARLGFYARALSLKITIRNLLCAPIELLGGSRW